MNESHKELLRQVQELFQASERRMAVSYDRIENAIDNCRLAMGGTVSSSSTSAWSDVCCVSEVPAPASSSPDTNLIVTTDVEDPAAPTPSRCSMEGPSRDSTELRSASAPATAPTTPTATVDIIVLAAASDGTLDGEAISAVAGRPATCSFVCLPRHLLASPVLVASSSPTPTEYVLDTNSVHVAVVPLAVPDVFPAVQLKQLYNDNGDETRPLPWPSFKEIDGCESPSDAVMKPSRQYRFGNLFTSTGCIIINDICISSELRCLDEVLLFLKYWSSTSDCVQSVQATFVWPPCSITRFKWDIIRSIEMKLLSNCSMPVTLQTVLLDSGNFSALSSEYLDFPCRSVVTVCLSSPLEPDHYFGGSQLKESLIMNSMRRSDSSYDQFSGTVQDASYWLWYFVTGSQMTIVFTAASRGSHWFASCVCGPAASSSISVLFDEWVLPPWDPGQQASLKVSGSNGSGVLSASKCYHRPTYTTPDFSDIGCLLHTDQFSCADRYTSCLPVCFATGSQKQVTATCSTRHLFPKVFSSNFSPVVMLELQLTRSSNHFVYLQELQIDRGGIEGVALNRVIINVNPCLLKWPGSILVYPADMGPHCSGISSASDGTSCESNKLEFKNKAFYMVQQYIDFSSFWLQATLHSLRKSTSRALMQGISLTNEGSYRFDAIVLSYMDFPAIYAPIHAGCAPSSICDASYSRKVALYMAARALLLLQDGIYRYSWADSKNRVYAGHAWLSHGFVLICLPDVQLLPTWPPPIAYC